MPYWVYILQNETTGKLYKGHTSDLEKRLERHNTHESGSMRLQKLEKVIPERTNGQVKFKPFLGGSLYSDYAAPTQIAAAGGLRMSYGGYNMASISEGWNGL